MNKSPDQSVFTRRACSLAAGEGSGSLYSDSPLYAFVLGLFDDGLPASRASSATAPIEAPPPSRSGRSLSRDSLCSRSQLLCLSKSKPALGPQLIHSEILRYPHFASGVSTMHRWRASTN